MEAKTIKSIDQDSVHSLTSGQVVVDLQTAVKELLENALDAGATSVELVFKNYGIDSFEVRDNGKGIDPSDWSGIALKHHTSKLTQFSDLIAVETLGFRGEALSSLCGTAVLSLVTSTATTTPKGTTLTFARNGDCQVGATVARSKGTTVTVKDLFSALPVRRKELERHSSREFKKALSLIQSYALIRTGCRFSVSNHLQGKAKTELLTPASLTVRSNFGAIFTGKSSPLIDMDLSLSVEPDKSVLKWSDPGAAGTIDVRVVGLISKPTSDGGRSSNDRQFFYVNGRPFLPPKIAKACNEVFKNYNAGSYPVVVADFQLPPDAYDVNVSPDKRTIFLHSEANLILALKDRLEALFEPFRGSYAMKPIILAKPAKVKVEKGIILPPAPVPAEEMEIDITNPFDIPNPFDTSPKRKRINSVPNSPKVDDVELNFETSRKKSKTNLAEPRILSRNSSIASATSQSSQSSIDQARADEMEIALEASEVEVEEEDIATPLLGDLLSTAEINSSPSADSPPRPIPPKLKQMTLDTTGTSWAKKLEVTSIKRVPSKRVEEEEEVEEEVEIQEDAAPRSASDTEAEEADDEIEVVEIETTEEMEDDGSSYSDDRLEHLQSLDSATSPISRSDRDEVGRTETPLGDITVPIDTESITSYWKELSHSPIHSVSSRRGENPLEAAAVDKIEGSGDVLSRIVKKEDFRKMEILGQFNLGFIIARRKVEVEIAMGEIEIQDDLFIVDQHASDEIYNFEQLQAKTVIQSQRLISPRELHLPSQDEMTAMENVEMLRLNGFELLVDEDAEVGKRVHLISLPVSKKTVFGVEDFEELLDLVSNSAPGEVVRPSKVRRMFASRACRKSVMIGTALSQSQMTNIVRHMGTMDKPWACPHGRPTALWLAGLNDKEKVNDTRADVASLISLYENEELEEEIEEM